MMKDDMPGSIKDFFDDRSGEAYSRFDDSHPFDIYLGIDDKGRKSMAIILDAGREKTLSSKTISVEFFRRDDNRSMLCFGLEDDGMAELFYNFCEDMIESTRQENPEEGFTPFISRWNTWVQFFSRTSLPLSESEILGLIGELHFLQHIMMEKYGLDAALESYIGTDKAHKDFAIKGTWYEVKSIHNGVRSVKISSIEQLESAKSGSLVVITLDQSTAGSEGNITLNGIVSDFRSVLGNKQKLLFDEKMRKVGYVEDERYDDYNYLFVKVDRYAVGSDFPIITKSILPNGITKVNYEIDISAIERFKSEL